MGEVVRRLSILIVAALALSQLAWKRKIHDSRLAEECWRGGGP